MATFRGMDGLMALGGYLLGAPFVNGAVSALDTTMSIDNNGSGTLTGVSGPGDTFVVGANTYTVTGTFKAAAANAIAGITFTPGAVGGFSDNAAITYNLNSIAQTRNWSLTPELAVLDQTVQGDKWYTCRSGLARWTGSFEALLDLGDTEQAALFAKVSGATPDGATVALLFGLQAGQAREYYGAAVVNNAVVTSALRDLVNVTMSFESDGILSKTYV